MRGTLSVGIDAMAQTGIIPADAGNTSSWPIASCVAGDHPRGCGEHLAVDKNWPVPSGSSPRMRGTRLPGSQINPIRRIIPADAGNTVRTPTQYRPSGDHPRGCGEHLKAIRQGFWTNGSSPRMRGTHKTKLIHLWVVRIIPADAGNTSSYFMQKSRIRDHPRGCGEHPMMFSFQAY